jgi:hypothetical protein
MSNIIQFPSPKNNAWEEGIRDAMELMNIRNDAIDFALDDIRNDIEAAQKIAATGLSIEISGAIDEASTKQITDNIQQAFSERQTASSNLLMTILAKLALAKATEYELNHE